MSVDWPACPNARSQLCEPERLPGIRSRLAIVARVGGVGLADAADGLDTAVAAGLVARADPRTNFRFSHDVVRDVVLGGIDSARRAELHLSVATVFEEQLPVDASLHAVVADHLDQAGPGRAEAAAAHWEQAALGARRVLAFDDAAKCLAHAERGWAADPRRRAALMVEEGECLLLAGNLEEARERFLHGAELAAWGRRARDHGSGGPRHWSGPGGVGGADRERRTRRARR